jgi:hypothetical protein
MPLRDNADAWRTQEAYVGGTSEENTNSNGEKMEFISSGRLIGPVTHGRAEIRRDEGMTSGGQGRWWSRIWCALDVVVERAFDPRENFRLVTCDRTAAPPRPRACARVAAPTVSQPTAVTSARHAAATVQQYTLSHRPANNLSCHTRARCRCRRCCWVPQSLVLYRRYRGCCTTAISPLLHRCYTVPCHCHHYHHHHHCLFRISALSVTLQS